MFITMPIKSFKLDGNKVLINESVIEYEPISDDSREILESLISKGAYGSALLTLNMFYNVKSINESEYTQEDYATYLGECNKLMEVNTIETEARNFRPLVNLNGLEIMESADHIARGKGNKLLIEDFRLNEDSDGYTGNSRADEIVFEFSESERDVIAFTKALNEISRMEYDNQISKDKYDECIKKIQDLFVHKDKSVDDLKEEAEGTQCSDIAEKKDQEVGSLQKPKKPKKHFNEMFKIPKNHGFKGFRLDENGHYIRGNYVLINEDGSIKAVNKNKLNETIVSKDLKTKDEYGNTVLDYDYAEKLMFQVIRTLNEKFKDYDYDFDFRIEEDTLKLFDTNEYFDYEDSNYEKVEQVVKQVIGDNHIYLEPENRVIMTIAGCYVK